MMLFKSKGELIMMSVKKIVGDFGTSNMKKIVLGVVCAMILTAAIFGGFLLRNKEFCKE